MPAFLPARNANVCLMPHSAAWLYRKRGQSWGNSEPCCKACTRSPIASKAKALAHPRFNGLNSAMGRVLLPEATVWRSSMTMARKSLKGGKEKRGGSVFVSVLLSAFNSCIYTKTSLTPGSGFLSTCSSEQFIYSKPLYIKTIKIISETTLWTTQVCS